MAPANPARAEQQNRKKGTKKRAQEPDGRNLAHGQHGERLEVGEHGDEAHGDAENIETRLARLHQRPAPAVEQRQHERDAEEVAEEHDLQGVDAGEGSAARGGSDADEQSHRQRHEQHGGDGMVAAAGLAAGPQHSGKRAQPIAHIGRQLRVSPICSSRCDVVGRISDRHPSVCPRHTIVAA